MTAAGEPALEWFHFAAGGFRSDLYLLRTVLVPGGSKKSVDAWAILSAAL